MTPVRAWLSFHCWSSFTATWGIVNPVQRIGMLTHFEGTADRAGKLEWKDAESKKGVALVSFAADMSILTLTWKQDGAPDATTTLYASDTSTCVAANLIR